MQNKLKIVGKKQERSAADFRIGSVGYNTRDWGGAVTENAKVGMNEQQKSEHKRKKNSMTKKRKKSICASGQRLKGGMFIFSLTF